MYGAHFFFGAMAGPIQRHCNDRFWLNPEVLTGVPERLLIPRNQTSGVVASLEGGSGDAVPCFAAYVSRGNNSSLTKLP